jgi:GMP synthase (glutamine-hydrolysing)
VVKVCWVRQTPPFFRQTPNQYLTKTRLGLLREIHMDVAEIIKKAKLYNKIWEFPIILLPIGMSDHGQSIALRPIESREVMTVTFYRLPKKMLNAIIKKIVTHKEIDAIFYDVTNKPPATVQWE